MIEEIEKERLERESHLASSGYVDFDGVHSNIPRMFNLPKEPRECYDVLS